MNPILFIDSDDEMNNDNLLTPNNNANPNPTGWQQVKEFHTVFCHPIKEVEDTTIVRTNPNLVKFRISLLAEEIKEFEDALEAKDYVEAVDALADTLYVLYGMCHTLGINFDKEITQYQHLIPSPPPSGLTFDDIKSYTFDTESVPTANQIIQSALNELVLATQNEDEFCQIKQKICHLYCATIKAAITIKLNPTLLTQCFAEVHRSNMTKSCATEEEAQQTVAWYKQNEPRYKDPHYRLSSDPRFWVIYDRETSKILKSIKVELPQPKLKLILGL